MGKKWQAVKLLYVAVDVYEEQIRAGRYFLHEHPVGASAWWRPSHDCTAKDHRCFHCMLTDVLFSSKNRDEEWFERCQQVRVQTNQIGDKFQVVAEHCIADVQTSVDRPFTDHIVMARGLNTQDGICIRTRACEHSASSTTTADAG